MEIQEYANLVMLQVQIVLLVIKMDLNNNVFHAQGKNYKEQVV